MAPVPGCIYTSLCTLVYLGVVCAMDDVHWMYLWSHDVSRVHPEGLGPFPSLFGNVLEVIHDLVLHKLYAVVVGEVGGGRSKLFILADAERHI